MKLDASHLLDLPGASVESVEVGDSIYFHLTVLGEGIRCPYCYKNTEEFHQNRPIVVRDLPISGKDVYLTLPRRQFYCRLCKRYITEELSFIDRRRKYTQRFEEYIFQQVSNSSVEQVSQQYRLSVEQVKNIFNYCNKKLNK